METKEVMGLSKAKIINLEEMRNKNGISLYRINYGNKFYVLKYFLNEE